ncbi:hypothetical protein CRG98_032056 [Punica granatum]|uniref:Uncharacterized protein n=1 Tax=Punica granatum TaxID=22663 RepID=A0A2I0IU86_PUNGR|nr:hypothetical protein CRG98_032056 [Punica granatum]
MATHSQARPHTFPLGRWTLLGRKIRPCEYAGPDETKFSPVKIDPDFALAQPLLILPPTSFFKPRTKKKRKKKGRREILDEDQRRNVKEEPLDPGECGPLAGEEEKEMAVVLSLKRAECGLEKFPLKYDDLWVIKGPFGFMM